MIFYNFIIINKESVIGMLSIDTWKKEKYYTTNLVIKKINNILVLYIF